jgi:uncharacterized membrane protein YjgN (DUF898 family)
MSDYAFKWLLTILTAGVAGSWGIYDAYSLVRSRKADRTNPTMRDKQFGYLVGIVIGVIGVVGCLRFHGVM